MNFVNFYTVANCPALTVGRLVKTSPNNCVTPQIKISGKCSFSCPQGYQLQGPSYKQCGATGKWTDSARSVSCKGELKITGVITMITTTIVVLVTLFKIILLRKIQTMALLDIDA